MKTFISFNGCDIEVLEGNSYVYQSSVKQSLFTKEKKIIELKWDAGSSIVNKQSSLWFWKE